MEREPWNWRLKSRYQSALAGLKMRYPVLSEMDGATDADIKTIDAVLNERMEHDKVMRLQGWHFTMDVNDKVVSQWIRAENCEEEPLHPKSNLHPQMRVEEEASKWEKLWPANLLN